jgi:hypothetical protein
VYSTCKRNPCQGLGTVRGCVFAYLTTAKVHRLHPVSGVVAFVSWYPIVIPFGIQNMHGPYPSSDGVQLECPTRNRHISRLAGCSHNICCRDRLTRLRVKGVGGNMSRSPDGWLEHMMRVVHVSQHAGKGLFEQLLSGSRMTKEGF